MPASWHCVILLAVFSKLAFAGPLDRQPRSVCSSFTNQQELCSLKPLYPYFSTKTTYTQAFNYLKSLGLPIGQLPSGYRPVLFYYFGRHGIRYPDADDIVALNDLSGNISTLVQRKGDEQFKDLCKDIVGQVRSFRSHWVRENDNHITESGFKELQAIGERYKKLLPSLLDPSRKEFSIDVGVSDKIRTTESASGFVRGLYGESYDEAKNLNAMPKHDVTMYHTSCKRARNGVKLEKNKVVKRFKKEAVLTEMMNSVLKRIGLPPGQMEFKDFTLFHELCSYNHAINGSSVWCSIFTADDLKLLEYYDDIDDYYSVHKDKAMKKAPCAVMNDILNSIGKTVSGQNSANAVLRFSHSGAIRPFLAYLGLFDNFGSEHEKDHIDYCVNGMMEREWRTSLISPFAANVAFILLKQETKDEYKVLTLVQEVPVKVDGCDKVLCSLKDFKKSFEKSVKKCDVQSICSKNED